jgi:hypothetical protein
VVPELRPRGIGEILDTAVVLYRARWKRLLAVSALVVVPVQVLSTIVLLSAQPDAINPSITGELTPSYSSLGVQLAAQLVILGVGIVSSAFVTAVCTRVVADAYSDYPDLRGDALRVARGRIFGLIGVGVLVALSQVAGVFACGIGIFVPMTWFAVAVPALVLEGVGVGRALGRSFELTKTHFFRVLGLVVTAQLLRFVLDGGLDALLLAGLRVGSGTTSGIIALGIAGAISSTLTTPFVATAFVVCYFDLRIRNEAFDVQLLMQRNDARLTAPDAPVVSAAAQ